MVETGGAVVTERRRGFVTIVVPSALISSIVAAFITAGIPYFFPNKKADAFVEVSSKKYEDEIASINKSIASHDAIIGEFRVQLGSLNTRTENVQKGVDDIKNLLIQESRRMR